MQQNLAKVGNLLFDAAPGLYGRLYSVYKRWSDRHERAWIASVVRPGDTVIDIGANIGAYTMFFADLVGPAGLVHALEPEPENFRRLGDAVAGLSNVRAHKLAASNTTGECVLYKSASLNVDHHTYDDGVEQRECVVIPCTRLDDLIAPGARVDFIKMDIQGAEGFALAGAQRVLEENSGIAMLFEHWPFAIRRSGFDPRDLLEGLRAQGFHLRVLGSGIGEAEGKDDYCNYIASRDPTIV